MIIKDNQIPLAPGGLVLARLNSFSYTGSADPAHDYPNWEYVYNLTNITGCVDSAGGTLINNYHGDDALVMTLSKIQVDVNKVKYKISLSVIQAWTLVAPFKEGCKGTTYVNMIPPFKTVCDRYVDNLEEINTVYDGELSFTGYSLGGLYTFDAGVIMKIAPIKYTWLPNALLLLLNPSALPPSKP